MEIKEKIEELVEKLQGDKNLAARFQKDPVSAVEDLLDVDLPDGQVEKIVEGVKAKLKLDDIGDKLGGLGDKLGGLLNK